MSERADAGAVAVAGDPVLPRRVGQDRVDHPRRLARPLFEIALRGLLDQGPVLPVVAGMAECRHQVAAAGERLGENAVAELAAADAMTEHDQRLDLVDRL